MTLPRGSLFADHYNILRLVERGGIALVYEVADVEHIGRRLLLRVPRPVFANDPRALDLFTRERLAFANLTSEHVVRVVEHGLGPDGPWMLTERCEGEPLSRRVASRGPLSWSDARHVLREVGDALSAAHAQGVLHLDLRPENVLLVRDGETARERVMVVDFGLSSAAMELACEVTNTPPRTRPAWMAPEQHDRSAYPDARADVWTYGLLAFWSLTGRAYWSTVDADGHANDTSALLREVRDGERHPASFRAITLEVAARLPEGFDAWFARCVATDPNARFDDIAPASAALDEVFATASGSERPSVARSPVAASDPFVSGPAYRAPTFTAAVPVTGAPPTPRAAPTQRARWVLPVALGLLTVAPLALAWSKRDASFRPTHAQIGALARPRWRCPAGMALVERSSTPVCLDRTEVTVRDYQSCVRHGACSEARSFIDGDARAMFCNTGREGRDEHPINCVTWAQAQGFCGRRGRLPTSQEWTHAATHGGRTVYPWGDEPPTSHLTNLCGGECRIEGLSRGQSFAWIDPWIDLYATTAPTTAFDEGATRTGLRNMVGNVWEWVADASTDDLHVMRGGGWLSTTTLVPTRDLEDRAGLKFSAADVGFRCAADPRRE